MQQFLGRTVDPLDPAVDVHGDHSGGDIFKHQLHKTRVFFQDLFTLFEKIGGLDQCHPVFLKLPAHGIEGIDQQSKVLIQWPPQCHLITKLPLGNPLGGLGKILDRLDKTLGQVKCNPGRDKNNKKQHQQEYHQKVSLNEFPGF